MIGSLDAGEPASLVENVDGDGGEEVTFTRPACYGSALKSPGLLQIIFFYLPQVTNIESKDGLLFTR
jgi:hypothetical protein